MERQDQLAQLFLRWHNLLLGLVSDLRVEYDVLNALKERLLCLLHVHNFLQLVVGLRLQLLRLICQERLIPLKVIGDLEGLEFNVLARESVLCQVLLDECGKFDVAVLVLQGLHAETLLLVKFRGECGRVIQEFIVVVLYEVNARFLILLDLL